MKVEDLHGKESDWTPKAGRDKKRSKLHIIAKELLKKKFPTAQILDEVPFKPVKGKTLFIDLYVVPHNIAVEVQGQQHYKRSSHFHQTPFALARQKSNDGLKKAWCEQNNITLVILEFDTIKLWGDKFE
jgi:hypothetical protein